MPRFKDAPLSDGYFRLFKFKPDRGHAIEISVKTFKIYKAPKYEGISYCWGEKSDGVATIICDGRPLEVWDNLYNALRRLRHEKSNDDNDETWYWNDALCIEQGDEEVAVTEKGRQIASMETIFLLAEPVRVWLGNASEREEHAFQYLADTCQRLSEEGGPRDATKLPSRTDEVWHFWAQVMIRPWFTRLWIVQEAFAEGRVVVTLGVNGQTSWSNFHEMVERIGAVAWTDEPLHYDRLDEHARRTVDRDFFLEWGMSLDEYVGHGGRGRTRDDAFKGTVFRNIVNIRELLHLEKNYNVDLYSFQQVIKVFGNRKCTYSQDRPNAMRGLLPDQLKKGLRAFRIDEDIAAVHREVSRLWLQRDPMLSLLQRIRPLRKFMPGSHEMSATKLSNPSWVIDLSRVVTQAVGDGVPNQVDGFHAGLVKSKTLFGKTEWEVPELSRMSRFKGSHKHVTFPTDTQCNIAGVTVGIVKSVMTRGEDSIRSNSPEAALQNPTYTQWIRDSLDLTLNAITDSNSAHDVHWRTLVLNQTYTSDPEVQLMFDVESKHSRRQQYDTTMKILQSGEPTFLHHADAATKHYYRSVYLQQYDFPTWFSTSSGLVGRSLAVPQLGDVVAVFYGAATPFLLRPVGHGQERFEFMGEAYVHGVMQGEALVEKDKNKYPKTLFELV